MHTKITMGVLAVAMVAITWALPAGGADAAGDKVTLKQHFTPGDYVQTVTIVTDQQMTIAGKNISGQSTQTFTMSFAIAKPDADGNKQATLAYKRIQMTTDQGGKKLAYDSAGPADAQDANLAKAMGPLTKVKLEMTIGKDDKVTGIKGLDALWEEMAKSDPQLAPMLAGMKQSFNDDTIKGMVEKMGELFPAKPLAVGDDWAVNTKMTVPMMGPMDIKQQCVLKAVEQSDAGKVAVIAYEAKIGSKENTTTMGAGQMSVKKLDLVMTGQMHANLENPMLQTMTGQMKGTIEVAVTDPNDKVAPSMDMKIDIDMKMEAKVAKGNE
jgi:hypothetical protein